MRISTYRQQRLKLPVFSQGWLEVALGRPQWRRGYRRVVTAMAIALLAVAAGALAVSQVPVRAALLLAVAAFAPYLELGALVSLAVFAAGRSLAGIALGLACLFGLILTHAGLFVADTAPAGPRLTVLTANLRVGSSDAEQLVALIRADHVDVLMVQELTSPQLRRLSAAGLGDVLSYSISDPRPMYAGSGLWSRFPLDHAQRRSDLMNAFVTASIRPSPGMPAVYLAALHLPGPFPVSADWTRDMDHLRTLLRSWPHDAPILIGGDFNATPDTGRFEQLLTGGFADAADQAGAGYTATFPANTWLPALIALDHVLVRGGVAGGVRTVSVRGSDHRALLVHIAFGH